MYEYTIKKCEDNFIIKTNIYSFYFFNSVYIEIIVLMQLNSTTIHTI